MLSPGGMSRASTYGRPRTRGARGRLLRVLTALGVLAAIAATTWYFLLGPASRPAGARQPPVACTSPAPRSVPAAVAAITPRRVTVNVYNGTDRTGLAARTAASLRQRGFTIGRIANDPLNRAPAGTAEVHGSSTNRNRVLLVVAYVDGAKPFTEPRRSDPTIDLVLGSKFTGLRTPAQVNALLKPAAKASKVQRASC